MYSENIIHEAVKGSDDYHGLMRSIAREGLRSKAGYTPQKTGPMELHRNFVKWTSKKHTMSLGVLWIFYAVECGHFSPSQARVIWRYGQFLEWTKKQMPQLQDCGVRDEHLDWIDENLLNMTRFRCYKTQGGTKSYILSSYIDTEELLKDWEEKFIISGDDWEDDLKHLSIRWIRYGLGFVLLGRCDYFDDIKYVVNEFVEWYGDEPLV